MIEKLNTKWCRHRALCLARQFGPWILVSLLLVAAFDQANSAALAGLFQSPPTETPTAEATPTLTPTVEATPTLTPTIEVEPTLTPTVEVEPTAPPADTPVPEPTLIVPSPAPEMMETPAITATAPFDQGSTPPGSEPVRGRYPDEESDLQFEWGMLFDSLALGLSYVWLGCGVLFMLLLPLFFLVLWIVARRRRRAME